MKSYNSHLNNESFVQNTFVKNVWGCTKKASTKVQFVLLQNDDGTIFQLSYAHLSQASLSTSYREWYLNTAFLLYHVWVKTAFGVNVVVGVTLKSSHFIQKAFEYVCTTQYKHPKKCSQFILYSYVIYILWLLFIRHYILNGIIGYISTICLNKKYHSWR